MLIFTHRQKEIGIIISKSRDGEYVASLAEEWGYKPFRGSTSKDGLRALFEIIKKLRSGLSCAFTPDGPGGPLRKVQRGVIYAARKTGRAVVPVAFSSRRAAVLGKWDEFIVPFPFNRILVTHGQPLYFGEDGDIDEQGARLERVLNALTFSADRHTGFRTKS